MGGDLDAADWPITDVDCSWPLRASCSRSSGTAKFGATFERPGWLTCVAPRELFTASARPRDAAPTPALGCVGRAPPLLHPGQQPHDSSLPALHRPASGGAVPPLRKCRLQQFLCAPDQDPDACGPQGTCRPNIPCTRLLAPIPVGARPAAPAASSTNVARRVAPSRSNVCHRDDPPSAASQTPGSRPCDLKGRFKASSVSTRLFRRRPCARRDRTRGGGWLDDNWFFNTRSSGPRHCLGIRASHTSGRTWHTRRSATNW